MLLPLPENLWNRYTAAHLLNRAGFGGTPTEIDALNSMGPASAVTSFLKATEDGDLFPVPTLALPAERMDYQERHKAAKSEEERREIRKAMAKSDHDAIRDLRLWWLNRMRYTSAPLLEKTTLFCRVTPDQKGRIIRFLKENGVTYHIYGHPFLPYNLIPSSIVGVPGYPVEDVTLENIEISYGGRSSKDIAYIPLDKIT